MVLRGLSCICVEEEHEILFTYTSYSLFELDEEEIWCLNMKLKRGLRHEMVKKSQLQVSL